MKRLIKTYGGEWGIRSYGWTWGGKHKMMVAVGLLLNSVNTCWN